MNKDTFPCDREKVMACYMAGWPLQEIADRLRLDRNTVRRIVRDTPRDEFVVMAHGCPYPGIRKYLVEHKMTFEALASLCGGRSEAYIVNCLRGNQQPSKRVIDLVLDYTGMTYEEAFRE